MAACRFGVVFASFGVAYAAYRVQLRNLAPAPLHATTSSRSLAIVAIGVAFVIAGTIAWSRRHPNRLGPLMIATGFPLFAPQFRCSHNEFVFTLFFWLGDVGYAMAGRKRR